MNLGSGEFCSPRILGDVFDMTLDGDEGELLTCCADAIHFSPVVLPPPLLSCFKLVIVLFMHRFNGSLFSLFSDDANGLPVGQNEVVGVWSTANCEFSK